MTSSPSSGPDRPRRVLYIDEGLSFGGALITTAHLVRYLDPTRYQAVVHSEVGKEILEYWFGETAKYYPAKRAFDYMHWTHAQGTFARLPFKWMRRIANYTLSLFSTIVNIPFHVRLAWLVHREGIDIIHHSNGNPRLFATLLGRPYVGTMQGIWPGPFSLLQRMAVKRTDRYIVISEAALEGYARAGGPTEITKIIPNPCDPAELSPEGKLAVREEFGFAADEKIFGIFGRIVHWKGQKEFVQAAIRVLDAVPDARAILIGAAVDGNEAYLDEVQAIAKASKHSARINFLGYVHEVDRLYNVTDVAVHASIEPEPFGLVVIEAMGFGVPIVAADAGGPLEIVDDGVDGYLVDPHDTAALADRITRLLTDDELRQGMAEAGRRKVDEKYHARHYARQVQEIYDTLD